MSIRKAYCFNEMKVALLTGGQDQHYALGLLGTLQRKPVHIEFIGNNVMATSEVVRAGHVQFCNLVGDQGPDTSIRQKVLRVLQYYTRLVMYAAHTDVKLFHILWFRKFPYIERTLLNVYFKILGKKLVFTAHNIDDQARNGQKRSFVNKFSLMFLYNIVDHVLVHTSKMESQLIEEFGIAKEKITVVPHGINDVIPEARVTRLEAKQQLAFGLNDKILLFFGNIAPYKGLEDLIRALAELIDEDDRFRLVIAGPVKAKDCEGYWQKLEKMIQALRLSDYVRKEVRFIPDEDVGVFFKASDVSVLPYKRIYQSGVLLLSYRQGLPVIAADVGSLREDIVEGQTGLIFRPGDPVDLAAKIRMYFASDLYRELESNGQRIREYGDNRFSWEKNVDYTIAVYKRLLKKDKRED
jgi:glycosyltransferase involved in cell wall biosynthesis